MFLSLSGTLTSSVNSLVSLIPSAISLTISAGRLMDIVEMPQEDYSQDSAVRNFEKQHKSEGIGLNMQDLSYILIVIPPKPSCGRKIIQIRKITSVIINCSLASL